MLNSITPRLLSWGMTFSGLGLGLIVASFVGENTPPMALLGLGSLGGGASDACGALPSWEEKQ